MACLAADPVPPQVSGLRVLQRPGTFYVDIWYDLIDPDSDAVKVGLEISADGGATYAVPAKALKGDVGILAPGRGKHIEWNVWDDWAGNFTTRGRARITVNDTQNAVFPPPFPPPAPDWVWIPPGNFIMGSPESEFGRYYWEGPQTQVYLSRGFFMCNHEVTQREYEAVKGSNNNPSTFNGDLRRPVESVSWDEAVRYCIQLTQEEWNAGRLRPGWQYRLPTEAEWEYACRAGTTTRFSYGDDPTYGQLPEYAWYNANSGNITHPVTSRLPNPWGLYDMHGNVREWCADGWDNLLPGGNVTDWSGPAGSSARTFRGGSWDRDYRDCRSAFRFAATAGQRFDNLVFRVVLAPSQP